MSDRRMTVVWAWRLMFVLGFICGVLITLAWPGQA
jgi:hypothetical protein